MKKICIIPARGGGGFPRKNVRPFLGEPMLTYPIREALQSGCFDEVMVSTDDEEIAEVARDARRFRLRSAANSSDHAMTVPAHLKCFASISRLGRISLWVAVSTRRRFLPWGSTFGQALKC